MNADIDIVYRSKALKILVLAPKHGQAGWRRIGSGPLEEITYCSLNQERWVPSWKKGWLGAEEYRLQKDRMRFAKQEYYSAHPKLIEKKIYAKRLHSGTFTRRAESWS